MSSKAETLDYLRRVRALIGQGWRQGGLALNGDGLPCDPCDERAVAWCILGAYDRAAPIADGWGNGVLTALRATLQSEGYVGTIPNWNDAIGRTKEEVLDLIDLTIIRVEREGR